MRRDLVIVGAGGFGRELLGFALDAISDGWPYRVTGFLDDKPDALNSFHTEVEVIGSTQDFQCHTGASFLIAMGDALLRQEMALRMSVAGARPATLVHPTSHVASSAEIDLGSILCPFSYVGSHSHIGANVAVNVYASVGHDAVIGSHSVLSPYVAVTGAARIGDCSFLGAHATVTPGVEVGRYSKVSAGAVVTKSAVPGSLLAGSPARGRVMFRVPE